MSYAPVITVFTSSAQPLTKRFTLLPDGTIHKETLATLWAGQADVNEVATATDLARTLEHLGANQAISIGRPKAASSIGIVTKAKKKAGLATRSLDDFEFAKGSGWLLWDYDAKTMPEDVAKRIHNLGGPLEAFFTIWPEARNGPYVIRPSSSDGITAPNAQALQSTGLHGFFLVDDMSQAKQALEALESRAWGAGLAWIELGKSGSKLRRSILDVSVGSPERLVFEAPPILVSPVTKSQRCTLIHDASSALDIPAISPSLLDIAQGKEAKARQDIDPEAKLVERQFVDARSLDLSKRTGKSIDDAQRTIRKMMEGSTLSDNHLLQLKGGQWVSVGSLLDDDSNHSLSMPDPIEGLDYGPDKATLFLKPRPSAQDGKPRLVSHAHGVTTVYKFERFEAPSSATPFYPAPEGDRDEAIAQHATTVEKFFTEALPSLKARQAVVNGYDTLDPFLNDAERSSAQSKIRQAAKDAFALDYTPTKNLANKVKLPRVMLSGAQGVGKTAALLLGLKDAHGLITFAAMPNVSKAYEAFEDFEALEGSKPAPMVLLGRGQPDPRVTNGDKMCRIPKSANKIARQGLSVRGTLCEGCPFADVCGYMKQERDARSLVEGVRGAVFFASHEYAFMGLPTGIKPDLVAFDEAPNGLGADKVFISFDDLAEALTFQGAGGIGTRTNTTDEAADAHAANLSDIQPLKIALRDAMQQSPANALEILHDKGITPEKIDKVLNALKWYQDSSLKSAVQNHKDAYHFAAQSGKPFNLDTRIDSAVKDGDLQRVSAFRRVLDVLKIELSTGRHSPVGLQKVTKKAKGKGVEAYYLKRLNLPDNTPFLYLDGTGDPTLAQKVFGPIVFACHRAERLADVTSITGKTFSNSSIIGGGKE